MEDRTPTVEVWFSKAMMDRVLGWLLLWPDVSRETLEKCAGLFRLADPKVFETDRELNIRYHAVTVAAELRRTVSDFSLIQERLHMDMRRHAEDGTLREVVEAALREGGALDENAVAEIASQLETKTALARISVMRRPLRRLTERLETEDYDDLGTFLGHAKTVLHKAALAVRDVEAGDRDSRLDFVLGETSEKVFHETVVALRKNNNMIRTGLKMHNDQIGGGWQAGRVYVYVGRTGGGKSLFLMNAMRWMRLYNKDVEASSPELKPAAMYLSLENDQYETSERLLDAFVPPSRRNDLEFKDMEARHIENILRENGAYDGTPPFLIFKYRRNKSLDTADIEGLLEKLRGEGYDVRLLLFDYIKRVRPVNATGELRLDLGEVVNEVSSMAKHWRLPIVTVMQMNITGIEELEKSARKDPERRTTDPLRKVGTSAVGESRLIVENADYVFCMDSPESPGDPGGKALTLMRIKGRGRVAEHAKQHIVYPYLETDSFLLDEDVASDRVAGRTSIGDGLGQWDGAAPENLAMAPRHTWTRPPEDFQYNGAVGEAVVDEDQKIPF